MTAAGFDYESKLKRIKILRKAKVNTLNYQKNNFLTSFRGNNSIIK